MTDTPIFLIGITGGTGAAFARLALEAGHHLIALVRDPARCTLQHQNLRVVQGDATHPDTVTTLSAGCRALVSAVGVTGFRPSMRPTRLYGDTGLALVLAAEAHGGLPIVAISSGGVERRGVPREFPAIYLYVMRPLLMETYLDQARMEGILTARAPGRLTLWRPGWLYDGPSTGRATRAERYTQPGRGRTNRLDLARAMLDDLDAPGPTQRIFTLGE